MQKWGVRLNLNFLGVISGAARISFRGGVIAFKAGPLVCGPPTHFQNLSIFHTHSAELALFTCTITQRESEPESFDLSSIIIRWSISTQPDHQPCDIEPCEQ